MIVFCLVAKKVELFFFFFRRIFLGNQTEVEGDMLVLLGLFVLS